jgi:hypothetical protein
LVATIRNLDSLEREMRAQVVYAADFRLVILQISSFRPFQDAPWARTLGIEGEESPLGDQQIRQAEQREALRRVLGQPFATYLLHAEDVLDDVERMLGGC